MPKHGPEAGNVLEVAADRAPPRPQGQPAVEALPAIPSALLPWPCLLPALLTAVLLWMCYYPLAWGWLAWIALVPLLSLVRSTASPARIYLSAWVAGLAFYWPVIQWMRVADYRMYATWAGLATYCALYVPLAVYLVRRLDRGTRLPLIVTVPVVWTALEYLRAHFGTGFPWYFLGHTQHSFLPIIQVSDLAGAYAVTFLVAGGNALVFEMLYTRGWFRRLLALPAMAATPYRGSLALQTGCVLFVLAAASVYGLVRLSQADFAVGPTVALIQGNLDQRIRNEASSDNRNDAAETMVKHYARLTDEAAIAEPRPDLIVWPETSYPDPWGETSPGQPDEYSRELVDTVARRWPTTVLLGLNAEVKGLDTRIRRYNSALLVRADRQVGGRYDKIHRVPFGEYVPLRDWLPWMNAFAPYDFDYSIQPGERQSRFALGRYHFGVLICFEDTDPYLARQYVRTDGGEAAADFLVNISNDGWFDGTSEHEEHLAICRFRAVECRRAVARAVNMGISAVIDGNGRVVALPGPSWAKSKKIAGVLRAAIPIDGRSSLYAAWGDWLPGTCWLILAAGVIASFVRRRHSRLRFAIPRSQNVNDSWRSLNVRDC